MAFNNALHYRRQTSSRPAPYPSARPVSSSIASSSRYASQPRLPGVGQALSSPATPTPSFVVSAPITTLTRRLRRQWIIGLDFGTTYSSVSWWHDGQPSNHVNPIDHWPGSQDLHLTTNRMISTIIRYATNFDGSADLTRPESLFGHQIPILPQEKKIYQQDGHVEYMKLLHDRGSRTETVRAKLTEVLNALVAKGIIKSHEQLFRDFFCLLLRATNKRLIESEGLTDHDNSKCTSRAACFLTDC